MKINKAKIAVAALAIATGVATAGSISGAYAWFQYNTRVNAAIVGTTANVGKNLQIRIHDDNIEAYDSTHSAWKTRLEVTDVQGYLDAKYAITGEDADAKKMGNGKAFSPITYGALAKNAALSTGTAVVEAGSARANPTSHRFNYSDWAAAIHCDFISLPLEVKLVGGSTTTEGEVALEGQNIYLTDLTIQKDSAAAQDMSSALRVHFASTVNQLWSNAASADAATSAYLDMDNNGSADMSRGSSTYVWSSTEFKTGVYGDGSDSSGVKVIDASKKVESYKVGTKNTAACPMADDTNDKLAVTNAQALGATNSSGILGITATIWFEGFAALESKQVWDYKFVGQTFNVGMSFAVDADR